jgi:hypothetical protein
MCGFIIMVKGDDMRMNTKVSKFNYRRWTFPLLIKRHESIVKQKHAFKILIIENNLTKHVDDAVKACTGLGCCQKCCGHILHEMKLQVICMQVTNTINLHIK